MSEANEGRRARAAGAEPRPARSYVLAAAGENVVLMETGTGRSWAMASEAGHPVWQPIAFKGGADRAPRGSAAADADEE